MNFATRVLATSTLVEAATVHQIEQALMDLDVEFFNNKGVIVVELDDSHTKDKVVDALKGPLNLRVEPGATKEPSFALVGPDWTAQKVGSALRIFKTK